MQAADKKHRADFPTDPPTALLCRLRPPGAALSWERESGDIRIREGKDGALKEEIQCMETRYKTDILFFLTCGSFSNTIKEKIEPNLEIRTDGEGTRIFYETNCVSVSEEKLADTGS